MGDDLNAEGFDEDRYNEGVPQTPSAMDDRRNRIMEEFKAMFELTTGETLNDLRQEMERMRADLARRTVHEMAHSQSLGRQTRSRLTGMTNLCEEWNPETVKKEIEELKAEVRSLKQNNIRLNEKIGTLENWKEI